MNREERIEAEFQAIESEILSVDAADNQNIIEAGGKKSGLNITTLTDLMCKNFGEIEWAVESLIPAEGITILSGYPASFKTWVILEMALKVSRGEDLFGYFSTTKQGVLIIDEENGDRQLQRRLKTLGCDSSEQIFISCLGGFTVTDQSINSIIKFADKNDVKLVIIDSLVRIHTVDENDASKMSGVFKKLKQLNVAGLTVLITHHNRKQGPFKVGPSQDMRGSSDILAAVDAHIAIVRENRTLTFHQTKLRVREELHPFEISVVSEEGADCLTFDYIGEADEVATKIVESKEKTLEILESESRPMFQKEILDFLKNGGFDVGSRTLREALKQLIADGKIFPSKGERNKKFYSLEKPEIECGKNTLLI